MNNPPAFPTLKSVTFCAPGSIQAARYDLVPDRPGMELRDYFAAHAPQPPSWFSATAPMSIPSKPEHAAYCEACQAGADCDGSKNCQEMQDWAELRDHVRDLNKMKTLVEWNFAYASAMLAERERKQS